MSENTLTYSYAKGSKDGTLILTVVGPLTLTNMFAFQVEFRATKPSRLIIDMTGVPYMDSAGLGLLMNYLVAAEAEQRKLLLACVSERIMALMEMTRVDQIMKIFPTVAAAEGA